MTIKNYSMKEFLTVKELITLLLEHNMDARVYVNASGVPTRLTQYNICWSGGGEGIPKEKASELIFDIQEEEELGKLGKL